MPALILERLRFTYANSPPVVDDVTIQIEAGSFFCLLGPSGCGKTTLLQLVGGYLPMQSGSIHLNGIDIGVLPPERRNIGMVFQNYALFPHLSARDNVAFGLEMRKIRRTERAKRVEAMLERVGLSVTEANRKPKELSGGQQQRVALARALVIEPQVLLLDEPLANLDRQLREQMRGELRDLQRQTGVTALFVTHDQEEALTLGDQVGILLEGRMLQVDTPEGLYQKPRMAFVARFLGDANLYDVAHVAEGQIELKEGGFLPATSHLSSVTPGCKLMIRPEAVMLGTDAAKLPFHWRGSVESVSFLGADRLLTFHGEGGFRCRIRHRSGALDFALGDAVTIGFPKEAIWIIPAASNGRAAHASQ